MREEFYVITMTTRNGKKLYLKEKEGQLPSQNLMEWGFDKEQAVWFTSFEETENFGKSYFKNFNNWHIDEVYVTI